MNLIGILLALLLEYRLSHWPEWRRHHWFLNLARGLRARITSAGFWNSPLALLCLVLPLPVLVFVVDHYAEAASVLLGVAWSVLVLLLCLGPRDLAEEVHTYVQNPDERDEVEQDLRAGMRWLRHKEAGPINLVSAVLVQGHERLLGVLLWFFVLGPLGACLYRLLAVMPRVLKDLGAGENLSRSAIRLHDLAAWLPCRITAGCYVLAGSADEAFQAWRNSSSNDSDWRSSSWQILASTGCAALREDDAVPYDLDNGDTDQEGNKVNIEGLKLALKSALGLVRRSLYILLAVFALFTLGGWIA